MDDIVEQLKCNVCFDVHSQIYQCSNGHIMCKECLNRHGNSIVKCAVCRSSFAWSRNRIVENMCEILNIQVPCGLEECPSQSCLKNISEHRRQCVFRKYECPIHDTCQDMTIHELIDHVKFEKMHVKELTECTNMNIRVFSNSKSSRQIIIFNQSLLIIDFVFHEAFSPWFDIYGACIGDKVRIKIKNKNPLNELYEECTCELNEQSKSIFKPKMFEGCVVSDSFTGISSYVSKKQECDVHDITFFANDLSCINMYNRENYAAFLNLQILRT